MKPIIGMISPRNESKEKPFNNYTKFVNTYSKRIIEAGGIPIGIVFPYGTFEIEPMEICDGFVLQGGPIIESGQINSVKYAIDKQKPILGICLGMQTMAGYNWINSELGSMQTYEEITNFFKPEDEDYFLEIRKNHNNIDPFYISQIEKAKHEITIDMESRLYKIYGEKKIKVPSLHNYVVKDDALDNSDLFKITAKSQDGTIEAIESLNPNHFCMGLQYHPELEEVHKQVFKTLIKEARKHK